MKIKSILTTVFLLILMQAKAAASEPRDGASATVTIDRRQKTVEVIPAGKEKFPYMRIRLPRKNKQPIELRLHAIEPAQEPLRYRGTFREWEGNMAGVEVEVSFDQKTWQRIKRLLH